MIDIQRYLLIAAIAALSFMLLVEWRNFDPQGPLASAKTVQVEDNTASAVTPEQQALPDNRDVPTLDSSNSDGDQPVADLDGGDTHSVVTVDTDVLSVKIDTQGGDIVFASLNDYNKELNSDSNFVLLENNPQRQFVAQSGLIGQDATDTAQGRPRYSVSSSEFNLGEQDVLNVDLMYAYSDDITITKRFQFKRGHYLVDVVYLIENRSNAAFNAAFFGQLKRDNSEDPGTNDDGGMFAMQPYLGVAYANDDDLYNKISFDKMRDKPLKQSVNGGWIGVVQHYFVSAWVPNQEVQNQLTTVVTGGGNNIARFTSPSVTVAAGSQGEFGASLYLGPKDQYRLEKIAPGLDLTVDYGWLWWIAQPLFWLLTQIHNLLGNWGWSIVGVTVLVKAAFFQLNAKAFKSMANMRKVQPKLMEVRERYADDKQKQSQAMMELYKKEKINPLGGCLPMLVQMPVFIALYWVLMESVELRHAPFMLWIDDLSAMDPYFVLPIIMGVSMFLQQKLNPPPPDPMQAKVMQWLPIIFTFFFLFFPAGLVLYWVVNNTLSIVQQYIITKGIEKAEQGKA